MTNRLKYRIGITRIYELANMTKYWFVLEFDLDDMAFTHIRYQNTWTFYTSNFFEAYETVVFLIYFGQFLHLTL